MPALDAATVNDSLRRLHRSALLALASCAIAIAAFAFLHATPGSEERALHSWLALVLVTGTLWMRRRAIGPGRSVRGFVLRSVGSLFGAVALGLLGFVVAWGGSQAVIGLAYTLLGVLLILRPPVSIDFRSGPDGRPV